MVCSVLMTVLMLGVVHANWYSDKDQGWFWYKKDPVADNPLPTQKDARAASQNPMTYTQKLSNLKKEVAEAQARAVLAPTLQNVHAFQKLQDKMVTRASRFSEQWMRASLLFPTKYRESDQASPHHREIFERTQRQDLEKKLKVLSQTHGLFFVFKENCPYCHQFAPLVADFARHYGFEVKAISADGRKIAAFPDAVADNGTIALINPEGIFPALFLVNPTTQKVTPIAWGMVSPSTLMDTLRQVLTQPEAP